MLRPAGDGSAPASRHADHPRQLCSRRLRSRFLLLSVAATVAMGIIGTTVLSSTVWGEVSRDGPPSLGPHPSPPHVPRRDAPPQTDGPLLITAIPAPDNKAVDDHRWFPRPLSGIRPPQPFVPIISPDGTYDRLPPHRAPPLGGQWWAAIGLDAPPPLKGPSRPSVLPAVLRAQQQQRASLSTNRSQNNTPPPPQTVLIEAATALIEPLSASWDSSEAAPVVPLPHHVAGPHPLAQETLKMAAAFAIYDANPASHTVLPAYAAACVGAADCRFIGHHIDLVHEFGVGYFMWVVNVQQSTDSQRRQHAKLLAVGRFLARAFPGRFLLVVPPPQEPFRYGCADVWNIIVRFFFSGRTPPKNRHHGGAGGPPTAVRPLWPPLPFAVIVNGDLFVLPDGMLAFLQHIHVQMAAPTSRSSAHSHGPTIIKGQHFSLFAYTYRAWEVLGYFDAAVYPAYAEDEEILYRLISASKGADDFRREDIFMGHEHYLHAVSASVADPATAAMLDRWGRVPYMLQKWNIDLSAPDPRRVFAHPWNNPRIAHRSAFDIDLEHRRCIATGHRRDERQATPPHPGPCPYRPPTV